MARQHRIEYAGALYHIMARGDRRENIVRDEEDRRRFLSTLGEACGRTGFVVHAYVLLPNHYHLALETPEPNLVDGMRWLQNTYTRRFNNRHKLWGHVFGGRYKALLIESKAPEYLRCLIDYIHLNPLRAGQVERNGGIGEYPWCSLREYVMPPGRRSAWLSVERGMRVAGLTDNPGDRRKYLGRLIARAQAAKPRQAGLVNVKEMGISLQSSIRRGWYLGSQAFRDERLKLAGDELEAKKAKKADGYDGVQMQAHNELRARQILVAGMKLFNLEAQELARLRCNDDRKLVIAEAIHSETVMRLDWIRDVLKMGARAYCSQLIIRHKNRLQQSPELRASRRELLNIEINTD